MRRAPATSLAEPVHPVETVEQLTASLASPIMFCSSESAFWLGRQSTICLRSAPLSTTHPPLKCHNLCMSISNRMNKPYYIYFSACVSSIVRISKCNNSAWGDSAPPSLF
ncbi:hypothetical protein KP509_24G081100 [Ceratopteris richardii]|uniref:Uncharacterized protein n=1 Tax=Ceratopteris richardii TaxID=49495 RepID=A0A8T2RW86_CERRI|nr:hypothetical protein KP509_24G081100 [Ceratopteris richardii]